MVDGYNRANAAGVPFSFVMDHDVARSLYQHDPDGNMVEIYADVEKDWRAMRQVRDSGSSADARGPGSRARAPRAPGMGGVAISSPAPRQRPPERMRKQVVEKDVQLHGDADIEIGRAHV